MGNAAPFKPFFVDGILLTVTEILDRIGFLEVKHRLITHAEIYTPPKTNMDTQTGGLEKVSPFKHGHFRYLC